MAGTISYRDLRAQRRNQAHSLFAHTMGYVAATAAMFTLGAYLGRNLGSGVSIIASFACLICMRFAARRSAQLTVLLLAGFGLLLRYRGLPPGHAIRPQARRWMPANTSATA